MRRHMKAVFVSTLFAALLLLAPGCAIGPHEGLSSPGSEQSAQTEQLPQATDLASLPAFSANPSLSSPTIAPRFRRPTSHASPFSSSLRSIASGAAVPPSRFSVLRACPRKSAAASGMSSRRAGILSNTTSWMGSTCTIGATSSRIGLCGENANERNLITGTRFLNVDGMLPYEDAVASYIEATGNHVLMRVTPLFEGDELVARGVQIEAQSIEDGGAGVRFNVYAYNAQPGVGIDYATGESWLDGTVDQEESLDASRYAYILNSNTKRFHRPDCPSVEDMGEGNKQGFDGTREEAIARGYEPCGRCDP